jgi:NAD(P)-dependent dehydrogenase (short-subunit alcohol dehydrogenase family)
MARFESGERPYMQSLVDRSPVPRMGSSGEIAELVAFLVSADASFMTGTDVLIDGGCAAMLSQRP